MNQLGRWEIKGSNRQSLVSCVCLGTPVNKLSAWSQPGPRSLKMSSNYRGNAGNGVFNFKIFGGGMPQAPLPSGSTHSACRPVSLAQGPHLYKVLEPPLYTDCCRTCSKGTSFAMLGVFGGGAVLLGGGMN